MKRIIIKNGNSPKRIVCSIKPAAPLREKQIWYLVDTENTGRDFLSLVLQKEENAHYLLFCTEHSPTVPLSIFPKLQEVLAHLEFVECCASGPNALDFQLVTYLGNLISAHKDDDFVVVTKDRGYDAAVMFWRNRGISVQRKALPGTQPAPTASVAEHKEATPPAKKQNATCTCIFINLEGVKKEQASKMEALLNECLSNQLRKVELHARFLKEFGQDEGIRLYGLAKSIINDTYKAHGMK